SPSITAAVPVIRAPPAEATAASVTQAATTPASREPPFREPIGRAYTRDFQSQDRRRGGANGSELLRRRALCVSLHPDAEPKGDQSHEAQAPPPRRRRRPRPCGGRGRIHGLPPPRPEEED